ncbi:MAG: discoidin domain-containing protein [Caldilineaceae bacterium]|nr:discoidin domain-containing protein [Caldilineaceae bacterium]
MLLGLLPADASAAPSAETAPFTVTGNVAGHVYLDFNGNGTRELTGAMPEDIGVYGVRLSLYDATGALVASKITNGDGNVGIDAPAFAGKPGPYRAEFTNLPAGYAPSGAAAGTQNGTTVQFILEDTAEARDLMLGVLVPSDYSASGADPLVAVPAMLAADNSIVDGNSGIATAQYSQISNSSAKTIAATNVQVGSVWGQGWQATKNRLFTGAYAKRHSGFGPQGPGGVYVTDFTNPASPNVKGFTLQGVTPANGGAAINLGSITRSGGSDYTLVSDPTTPSVDLDAYAKIGKVAYGDVDVDFTGRRLWLVNLNQRALVSLDISGPVTNGVVPGAANQYLLTNATGIPSCAGTIRPFGLEFYGETGYLGVVCDGNDGGTRSRAALRGYVLSFTPPALGDTSTTALAFSTALEIPMDYRDGKGETAAGPYLNSYYPSHGTGDDADSRWQPWVDDYLNDTFDRIPNTYHGGPGITPRRSYPQPVVADIEIDPTGNMTIGILNRWGDQIGSANYYPIPGGAAPFLLEINNAGDTIKACLLGAVYALESTDYRCPVYDQGVPFDPNNILDDYDPNRTLGLIGDSFSGATDKGEFYWGDKYHVPNSATHYETTGGGLGMWPGKREMLSNSYNPYTSLFSNGVIQLSMVNGEKIAGWTVVPSRPNIPPPGIQYDRNFGKGNSMGDIEILNKAAPTEIGNRIWNDLNGDGIQDPNEDPIAGVTVTLWADTTGDGVANAQVGTTVTSATGEWYFGGPENVRMTGGNSIQPYTAYEVRVNTTQSAVSGMTVTQPNAAQPANGNTSATDNNAVTDVADSDAVMNGTTAVIAYTTARPGDNNHGLDFGFVATGSIGNYVWLDEDNDGHQDAGERGIPNVVVTLTPPANVDLGNGFGQPITTVTDANGGYLFPDLPAADGYVITIDGGQAALDGQGLNYTVPNNNGDSNQEDFGNQNPAGYTVDLSPGENDLSADFGYNYNTNTEVNENTGTAAIGDRVWIDSNGDGKQDPSEVGVEGVQVTLYSGPGPDGIWGTADDVVADTTTTDANGYYLFDDLTPGAYAVGVTADSGASQPILGSGYAQTGDPDHFGTTGTNNDNFGEPVVLDPGDVFLNMDFGYQPGTAILNSIGDTIFYDADADGRGPSLPPVDGGAAVTQGAGGTADAIDYGISGVTVSLIRNSDNAVIATDVTDEKGQYLFEDLPDGAYTVWVNDADGVLSGLNQSYDADGLATPNTSVVSVSGGQHNRFQDFGYTNNQPGVTPQGTIGDRVWYDLDGDGVQDPNEGGIPGVTVELCSAVNNDLSLGYNLALGMPASASESHVASVPSDANDGNRNGYYPAGSVWTADNISPSSTWWQVDLGSIQDITRIDLYNRTDNNLQFRLSNAWVLISDTDFGATPLGTALTNTPAGKKFNLGDMTGINYKQLSMSTSGRYVRVWGADPTPTPFLNLAELEVYNEDACRTAVTDEQGNYIFTGLPIDANGETYTVTVDPTTLPGGLTQTYDDDGLGTPNTSTTTISTGNPIDLDQDFGYNGNNSLGNLVWLDSNADGVWQGVNGPDGQSTPGSTNTDDDEPLIDGVTLDIYRDVNNNGLFDSEDAFVTTAKTTGTAGTVGADQGNYLVTGLPDGTYFVNVSDDDGVLNGYWHSLGTPNLTNNSQNDAYYKVELDKNSTNPTSVQNLTADFGYYVEPASLGNYVWVDENPQNGRQDDGETGLNGVTVQLTIVYPGQDGDINTAGDNSTTVLTTLTKDDASGNPGWYSFDNLLLDEDYNGIGQAIDNDGNPAGDEPTFTISVDPDQAALDGYVPTDANVNNNNNDKEDSDDFAGVTAEPIQGLTDVEARDPATNEQKIASYDFGLVSAPLGAIGNYVWLDENSDGYQDEGEPGLPNVVVVLYGDPDGDGTVQEVDRTLTDSHGGYLFDQLAPGDYYVDVWDGTGGTTYTMPYGDGNAATPNDGDMTQTPPSTLPNADFGNQDHGTTSIPNNPGLTGYPVTIGGDEPLENLTADFGYNVNTEPEVDGGSGDAALGDRLWIDTDGDGVQDPEEVGVEGATVTLYSDPGSDGVWGTPDDVQYTTDGYSPTRTTDENGYYMFDGLEPGAYVVKVTSSVGASHPIPTVTNGQTANGYTQTGDPDHFAQTDTSAGNNDGQTTAPVVLAPGDVFLNADFGYQPVSAPVGRIGDTVWLDVDGSGGDQTTQGTEPGIPGVTVVLIQDLNGNGVWDIGSEPILATDTTDENGYYIFEGLPLNDFANAPNDAAYIVKVTDTNNVLAGLEQTYDQDGPLDGTSFTVLNGTTTEDLDQDFSYTPMGQEPGLGLIGDTIFYDADPGDGIDYNPAAGDTPIEGVLVELRVPGTSQVLATQVTDENGLYFFPGLDPNEEYEVVVSPLNFLPGGVLEGLNNTADPNGDNNNKSTVDLGDPSGDGPNDPDGTDNGINLGQDFGYRAPTSTAGSIGNRVWLDQNADGLWDGDGGPDNNPGTIDDNEPGIAGVTLDLYRDLNGNGLIDPGEPRVGTQTTDAGGLYLFDGLAYGNYVVDVTDTAGILTGYWHSIAPDQNVYTDDNADAETAEDTVDRSKHDPVAVSIGVDSPSDADTNAEPANNLNADFGYYVEPAALGNYVWVDEDKNGLQNESKSLGLNGVEVTLTIVYPDTGSTTTVLTTLTKNDADGNPGWYSFNNLLLDEDYNGIGGAVDDNGAPAGDEPTFTISVSSSQSALVNNGQPYPYLPTAINATYTPDSEKSDLVDSDNFSGVTAEPVQGLTDVQAKASGLDEPTIASYDFGVFLDTPLAAALNYAYSERAADGTVYFIWETATETGNAGFNLYMELADGSEQSANGELVPSSVIDSVAPTRYTYQANVAGESYYIEFVNVDGSTERYGAFKVGEEYGEPADVDQSTLTNPLYLPFIEGR